MRRSSAAHACAMTPRVPNGLRRFTGGGGGGGGGRSARELAAAARCDGARCAARMQPRTVRLKLRRYKVGGEVGDARQRLQRGVHETRVAEVAQPHGAALRRRAALVALCRLPCQPAQRARRRARRHARHRRSHQRNARARAQEHDKRRGGAARPRRGRASQCRAPDDRRRHGRRRSSSSGQRRQHLDTPRHAQAHVLSNGAKRAHKRSAHGAARARAPRAAGAAAPLSGCAQAQLRCTTRRQRPSPRAAIDTRLLRQRRNRLAREAATAGMQQR